jgi:hypothetical protein
MTYRNTLIGLMAVVLAGCSPTGQEIEGRWISALMGDYFDCQGNLATLSVEHDRIVVFLAGQPAQVFDGLETSATSNGGVEKRSDRAHFIFDDIEGDRMVLRTGPSMERTMLNNIPVDLRRCP